MIKNKKIKTFKNKNYTIPKYDKRILGKSVENAYMTDLLQALINAEKQMIVKWNDTNCLFPKQLHDLVKH